MADSDNSRFPVRWTAIVTAALSLPFIGYLFKKADEVKPLPVPPPAIANVTPDPDATPGPLAPEAEPSLQEQVEARKAELNTKIHDYVGSKIIQLEADIQRRLAEPDSLANDRAIDLEQRLVNKLRFFGDEAHSLTNYIAGKILEGQDPVKQIENEVESLETQAVSSGDIDERTYAERSKGFDVQLTMLTDKTTPAAGAAYIK